MFQPIFQEFPYQCPFKLFSCFSDQPGSIFFDSAPNPALEWPSNTGRYSFFAIDPVYTLTSKNGDITYNGEKLKGNPFDILQESLKDFRCQDETDLPPWQGGVAGYFSYNLCHHLEEIPSHKNDNFQFPDLVLGYYDVVAAFDHQLKKSYVFSTGYPETDNQKRLSKAEARVNEFLSKINNAQPKAYKDPGALSELQCNFTEADYKNAVQKVIDYICAGDIFQANLSRRLSTTLPTGYDLGALYNKLRNNNPAPFSVYFNADPTYILSSSPERFLSLRGGQVETRPIKGTRKRSSDSIEDQKLKEGLQNSEKDQAENIMIVDLMRNDLSRVCKPHTVKTPELLQVETYTTVHHLVSSVVGELKDGVDAIDLLKATFPGGSITGAPKIRAMEIIAELEPTARGPYCGAIGYIGFNGAMDTNITIRTIAVQDSKLCFQAGGGIVADSEPSDEYQETEAKAAALKRALLD